jgi:hypothetical protein
VREIGAKAPGATRRLAILVQLFELCDALLESPEERLDVEPAARDACDELVGRELGAV